MSAIHWKLFGVFTLHRAFRNSNKHLFCPNHAKKTIFSNTYNFWQIIAKINRALKKTYTNIHAKFQSDPCNLYWVITWKKIDNLHTNKQTDARTNKQTNDFFFNLYHIYTKKIAKFDNWLLRPIQGFTQSKIEKAILNHCILNKCIISRS